MRGAEQRPAEEDVVPPNATKPLRLPLAASVSTRIRSARVLADLRQPLRRRTSISVLAEFVRLAPIVLSRSCELLAARPSSYLPSTCAHHKVTMSNRATRFRPPTPLVHKNLSFSPSIPTNPRNPHPNPSTKRTPLSIKPRPGAPTQQRSPAHPRPTHARGQDCRHHEVRIDAQPPSRPAFVAHQPTCQGLLRGTVPRRGFAQLRSAGRARATEQRATRAQDARRERPRC